MKGPIATIESDDCQDDCQNILCVCENIAIQAVGGGGVSSRELLLDEKAADADLCASASSRRRDRVVVGRIIMKRANSTRTRANTLANPGAPSSPVVGSWRMPKPDCTVQSSSYTEMSVLYCTD